MFSFKDDKHIRLVRFLLRPDQSFVNSELLKKDLKKLSEEWEALSIEEKIRLKRERVFAPPENQDSEVFRLEKKHRNETRQWARYVLPN